MAEQALIFFHIHKTGGQTLEGVIRRQYPRNTVREIWLQRPETIEEFLSLPDEERARFRALIGHIPFGFHRHLPQGARYVTLLRDPVKRFLSEYRHLSDLPEEWGVWRPPEECLESVDSYLDYLISNHLCNAQTRMIAGFVEPADRPPLPPCPPDALERAKRHLENDFAVVGATERYDESLALIGHAFGWTKSLHYMRRNVRERQPFRKPVSEDTLERIRESHALDIDLVAHGARLLDAQLTQVGDALDESLRRLRRVNANLERLLAFAHHPAVRSIRSVPGLRQFYNLAGVLVRRVT